MIGPLQPKRPNRKRVISCRGSPPVARSARISPTSGANLKPWPEQARRRQSLARRQASRSIEENSPVRGQGIKASLCRESRAVGRRECGRRARRGSRLSSASDTARSVIVIGIDESGLLW